MSQNNSYEYLLDTNIVSDLVRNPQGKVAERIILEGNSKVCTSIIVASKMRFGIEKRGSSRLTKQVEAILSAIDILPYQEPADSCYAKLRNQLEKSGMPIGPNDMLIAAQALALELVVVTANEDEFSRISGLKVENWLKA